MNKVAELPARDDLRLGPLKDSLGFLLRLSQLVSFDDFYANFADADTRPGEISVLMLIGENPGVRQGVLARNLLIKRAHMAKMVRSFEKTGLVTKSVPPNDKRGVELRLTAKGERHITDVRPAFVAHEAGARHGLSAAEEMELKRLLRKFLGMPETGGQP